LELSIAKVEVLSLETTDHGLLRASINKSKIRMKIKIKKRIKSRIKIRSMTQSAA